MADRKIYNETLSAESTLGKRVCNDFEIKNLEPYHDLYVQSNMLLLADVFENCPKFCLDVNLTLFIFLLLQDLRDKQP